MKKKNQKNFIQTIKRVAFYFVIFSFLGWIWEVFLSFTTTGVFINRGMLFGPWTPIYGFGGIGVLLLSKKFKKPWQLFLAAFIISGVLEYLTATILEEIYGAKWWDYNMLYFNIQGKICLEYLLAFAVVVCLAVYLVVPKIDILFRKINPKIMTIILIVILLLICADFIYSIFSPNNAAVVGNLVPRVGIEPALYP